MSTSFTYATLLTALQTTVEDAGSEYVAFLPTAIQLAEDKILRDLDLELFDTVTPLAFTASTALLTKPTGAIATRTLHYTDATGNFQLLEPRSWEFVKDYWPKEATTTASPKYFAEYSATQYYVAGTPSGTNVVTARCVVNPAGLTSIVTTTWLSTYMGDLLLYACLVISEEYLKADNRIGMWKQDYNDRLASAKRVLKPEDRTDYTPITVTSEREGVA
jgi:hypothetical protein